MTPMGDTSEDAAFEQGTAILRALCGLRTTDLSASLIARELLAHVEGRIGWNDVTTSVEDVGIVEEGARAFASLGRSITAFGLMSRLDPRRHPGILGIAVQALPQIDPARLFAERRWIAQLFPALIANPLRKDVDALIHALHGNGHFELVQALRRSRLGELTDANSWRLIDARHACWAGRYADVAPALQGATLSGAHRVEADMCSIIARAELGDPPSDAAMAALVEQAARIPGLDEATKRWRAEFLVRSRCSDRRLVSQRLADAAEHAALHLLYRIADHGAPPRKQTEDPTWGFHTYILELLRDAGVAEAREALAAGDAPPEDEMLWRVLARLGGNRTNYGTVVDAESGVRAVPLRTARQEAIASQGQLPEIGAPAVLALLAELEQRHPGHSVFATYQAEIVLWLGQYAEAARRFDIEVRRAATRWGEVGLGAALAGLGEDAEAERVWAMGHQRHHGALSGEATFVYKAEIAARRGDLGAARALLDGVLAAKPTRMRGWLLHAEIDWKQREDGAARQALLRAIALCPGIVTTIAPSDAPIAALLEQRPPTAGERDALIAWCQAMRSALGGNASSWLYTWFDAQGAFRAFPGVPASDLRLALQSTERIVRHNAAPSRG